MITKETSLSIVFFVLFFSSGICPEISTLHNDPAAHQDHCVRCRIWTRNLCPQKSGGLLMSHHISEMSHHISKMSHHISQWANRSPHEPPHLHMSHHISTWATTSPHEPPHLHMSHQISTWATTSPSVHCTEIVCCCTTIICICLSWWMALHPPFPKPDQWPCRWKGPANKSQLSRFLRRFRHYTLLLGMIWNKP